MSKHRLLDLSERFDGVIQKLKASYIDLGVTPNWIMWLLLAPIRDLAKIGDIKEGLVKFLSSSMLPLLPILSFAFGPIVLEQFPIAPVAQNIVGALVGYLFSLIFYWKQLLDFTSPHFHLGAYRTFRRQEYNLLSAAFLDNKDEFYFKGLYDQVNDSTATYELVNKSLNGYIQNDKAGYEKRIIESDEKLRNWEIFYEKLVNKAELALEEALDENKQAHRYIKFLEKLFERMSKIFSRMAYGRFTISDLNLLGGFLIYEYREGNEYISLLADVDTHSKSKDRILLSEDTGQTNLIKQQSSKEYANFKKKLTNVSYVETSFLMEMGNGVKWIYSFHTEASDEYTLNILADDDMLNVIELHTLIHSICLMIIRDTEVKSKEGAAEHGTNRRGVSGT